MHATVNLNNLPDHWDLPIALDVPPHLRRGKHRDNQKATIQHAVNNLKGIAARLDDGDWSNKRILDFGCGSRFAQCMLQFDLAVGEYVGIDTAITIIDWLVLNVKSDNYRFFKVPFYNESFNLLGRPMKADSLLPGKQSPYDLIIAISVFTHFNPEDFQNALHILRRYAHEDTRFFFTCFIGPSLQKEDFIDGTPNVQLLKAIYREDFVREMLDKAGWEPFVYCYPSFGMQHHFACKPK